MSLQSGIFFKVQNFDTKMALNIIVVHMVGCLLPNCSLNTGKQIFFYLDAFISLLPQI